MPTISLIRTAEIDGNFNQFDHEIPLSEEGVHVAQEARKAFNNRQFGIVIGSPRLNSLETGMLVAGLNGSQSIIRLETLSINQGSVCRRNVSKMYKRFGNASMRPYIDHRMKGSFFIQGLAATAEIKEIIDKSNISPDSNILVIGDPVVMSSVCLAFERKLLGFLLDHVFGPATGIKITA